MTWTQALAAVVFGVVALAMGADIFPRSFWGYTGLAIFVLFGGFVGAVFTMPPRPRKTEVEGGAPDA